MSFSPFVAPSFRWLGVFVMLATLAVGDVRRATACPFCSAAQQTLTEELTTADAAIIATLATPMPDLDLNAPESFDAKPQGAVFHIEEVLRGGEHLEGAKDVEVVYFGDDQPGQRFLITGLIDQRLDWITPLPLSDAAIDYVKQLPNLPAAGPDRLAFFQEYFEHADPLIAQDAYDEFSRAPYQDIVDLGSRINRDNLLRWIDDPTVGPSSRRLYLTMLGVCGQPEDVAFLEGLVAYDYAVIRPASAVLVSTAGLTGSAWGVPQVDEMLHAEERRKKESLDALLACYLKLKGPEGLKLVNERFLANPDTEYKYMHAAIMALRFHGEETEVLPREALLDSMRLALDHKEFADQVIPDLTRWQDWEVMDRLVAMFRASDSNDWIRQPVASYLLVAAEEPGDVGRRAQAALEEVKTLDPDTYQRAKSFAGFGYFGAATATKPATASSADVAATESTDEAKKTDADEVGTAEAPEPEADVPSAATTGSDPARVPDDAVAQASPTATKAELAVAVPAEPVRTPKRWLMIGGPVLGVVVLMAIFAALLKGADPRSTGGGP
ncbi:MAG: hypothetical protein KDA44_20385 [Planctomycetales bacterium]|nr:hypothetical protein [Planctomycetales bacterium]